MRRSLRPFFILRLYGRDAIKFQPEEAYAQAMSLDWKSEALACGLECYRNAEFFDAHEHWESVWLRLEEPEKSFLQALIQMAAAFHHLNGGNHRGAASLLRRALRRFDLCDGWFGGIAMEPFREEVRAWLRALESGRQPLPDAVPRICPMNLP